MSGAVQCGAVLDGSLVSFYCTSFVGSIMRDVDISYNDIVFDRRRWSWEYSWDGCRFCKFVNATAFREQVNLSRRSNR